MHHNLKKERNDEIKALFKEGMKQGEIGKKYGLTQSRVSCIIKDKLPYYRYCTYCHDRIEHSKSVCSKCLAKNIRARKERIEAREADLLARREARKVKLEALRVFREEEAEKKHQAYLNRIEEQNFYTQGRVKIRFDRDLVDSFKKASWQSEGREKARFLTRFRDNFTCQDCSRVRLPKDVGIGKTFKKSLDVHHLNGICGKNSKGYDSPKDISGLITLCHKCHFNRHDWQPRIKKNAVLA